MDRLEQVSTVAGSVVEEAEAPCTAKIYELDNAGGHQHDIVSFQVPVDHPVQVQVGHPFQDLMGVQGQDTLRERAKSEGGKGDNVLCVKVILTDNHSEIFEHYNLMFLSVICAKKYIF